MTGTLTRQQSRDHPRLRGEYHYICQTRTKRWGSPPLARGIQLWRQPSNLESGITPACAGNTLLLRTNETSSWDHPRLRGEYGSRLKHREVSKGSPPLARGIRNLRRSFPTTRRITPACAGNTCVRDSYVSIKQDHPRLRGEYDLGQGLLLQAIGSPPLARGIPCVFNCETV